MHAAWRRCRVGRIGTLAIFVALALIATAPAADAQESSGAPGAADTLATQTVDEAVSALDVSVTGGIVASVSGRGWGHGRGLGQYGALGYAIDDAWSRDQILAHFYGNTTPGAIANDLWTIRLLALDGQPTTVQVSGSGLGVSTDGVTWTYVPAHGLRLTANPTGTGFLLEYGNGCGATLYPYLNLTGSTVHVRPALDDGFGNIAYLDATDQSLDYTLQVCTGPTSSTYYRGDIRAVLDRPDPAQPVVQRTVNVLPIEQYLRGVVPREMPASWSDLGGGSGRNALQAQAVAARSYSAAENRYSYARTCDTTSCQVYAGRATWTTTAGIKVLEDARADAAIAATAGVVRSRDGQVTRTEFSSSTGGYTAGGTFPAVPDDGDDISSNPNRTWSTTLSAATIEQRYARSPLTSITVTERSGLGADGGRVVKVLLTFGDGFTIERTGNQFRIDFGLKSDWFSITLTGAPQTAREASDDGLHGHRVRRPDGGGDLPRDDPGAAPAHRRVDHGVLHRPLPQPQRGRAAQPPAGLRTAHQGDDLLSPRGRTAAAHGDASLDARSGASAKGRSLGPDVPRGPRQSPKGASADVSRGSWSSDDPSPIPTVVEEQIHQRRPAGAVGQRSDPVAVVNGRGYRVQHAEPHHRRVDLALAGAPILSGLAEQQHDHASTHAA